MNQSGNIPGLAYQRDHLNTLKKSLAGNGVLLCKSLIFDRCGVLLSLRKNR